MKLPEFIDRVNSEISVSGMIPTALLKKVEIQRITEEASKYMYKWNPMSSIESYLYIPFENFKNKKYAAFKHFNIDKSVELPCEVRAIREVYQTNKSNMFEFGIHAPNMNVGLGISNQPYLSSFVTTIGELGVYKVMIDSFSDMIEKLNRRKIRFDYNPYSNMMTLLSPLERRGDIILNIYEKLELEELLNDELMYRLVVARAKKQLARIYGLFQAPLTGNVTVNYDMLSGEADEEITKIEEEIQALNNMGYFYTTP